MSEDLTCQYCHYQFVRESAYRDHVCDKMRREDASRTPTGQSAYALYATWMTALSRPVPELESFVASKLFITFIKFVIFTKDANLPQPTEFVRWAAKRGLSPILWMRDSVYVDYLNHLDATPPEQQVLATAKFIVSWCEDREIDTSEFFDNIHPNEFVHAVQTRKIFPWLCIAMEKFKDYFSECMPPEHKVITENIFNIRTIFDQIEHEPDHLNSARDVADALGL